MKELNSTTINSQQSTFNCLLITPPFTQLNTPYPATAYLKGFLNTKNISSYQIDLGIEVILKLFSKNGLENIFNSITTITNYSNNAQRIFSLQKNYLQTIDDVINFLQSNNQTLAYYISTRNFLPEANRFLNIAVEDMQHAFGTMGLQDKAKHFATLYLEDLCDFIKECIDPHFGFSRYAEQLARSANTFDNLELELTQPSTIVQDIMLDILHQNCKKHQPQLVCFSVPFPGNLFAALRCGQYIKTHFPNIKIAMGGGYANTELRSLQDARVFNYLDFITLDDGEMPLENIILYLQKKIELQNLKRTFIIQNNKVVYINNSNCKDYNQSQIGTPNYSDLLLDKYISAIEIINPMHSLWSNGRWNKLTMAHGCYWSKCTFCDISLPYIKDYEPITANLICDRIEKIILQTGTNGFHFVDEAAPPALMKEVAIEIIKRKINITWWTNIRFEKSFTQDLCLLLKQSGCIGVSGGLEVASDRLLALINKGITVAQVAQVNKNFTQAGIMVHAYLMYGFPTQTVQETIDSLEMVRQLFATGILQSAYWHRFAMTAHSPVGLNPEAFKVQYKNKTIGTFANNDIEYNEIKEVKHELFSDGLKTSIFNFMNGIGYDYPLQKWFDTKMPSTKIANNYIQQILETNTIENFKPNNKILFIGNLPSINYFTKTKKGNEWLMATLSFITLKDTIEIKLPQIQADWLIAFLPKCKIENNNFTTMQDAETSYELQTDLDDFELFWYNTPMNDIRKVGILVV